MKTITIITASAILAVSLASGAQAARHTERHQEGEIYQTYGDLDLRRNDWREARRDEIEPAFSRESEQRYGNHRERKDFWRNQYRDKFSQ